MGHMFTFQQNGVSRQYRPWSFKYFFCDFIFFILRKLQPLVWKLIWIFGFSLQVLKFDQFTWTTISSKLYLSPSSLPLKIPACRGHCLVLSSSTLQPCLLCFASFDVEPDCFFILLGIGWFFQFKMFDASIGMQIIFVSNGNNFYTEWMCVFTTVRCKLIGVQQRKFKWWYVLRV